MTDIKIEDIDLQSISIEGDNADLHSPQFFPDEEAIVIGVNLFFQLI